MKTVNEMNAYKFSDSFTIQTAEESVNVFGCEHNEQEAIAIARWLEGEKGVRVVVVRNGVDSVRAAKQFKPAPYRFQHREAALREMGVWQ